MSAQTFAPLTTAAAVAAAALLGVVTLLLWRRRRTGPPRWRAAGRLAAISVYPLKSGAGVSCRQARVTSLGLRTEAGVLDRSLAVVCDGKVLMSSNRRKLVLISANVTGEQVTLTAPSQPSLTLKLPQADNLDKVTIIKVILDEHPDSGVDLGPKAGVWLRDFFADTKKYNLIYFFPELLTPRKTVELPEPYAHLAAPTDVTAYNTISALSVICSASLDELNKRLKVPVTFDNFRLNFIIADAPAFDDDAWDQIKIGTAFLRRIKPVNRCIFTCADPKTGERSKELEPLRTLRKFRMPKTKEDKKLYTAPLFGSCLGVDVEGKVEVGDFVYALPRQ